jgi:hypothetical protein
LHEVPEFGHGKSAFSQSELKQFIYMLIAEDVILEELYFYRGPNEIGSHPYLLCGSRGVRTIPACNAVRRGFLHIIDFSLCAVIVRSAFAVFTPRGFKRFRIDL